MDIDLLSKMVKELILDNERVVLPGLGSFVAEIVPATFSDKGYTINPPYRKLYFRSKPDEGSELIPFYAKSNSVSEEIAEKVIVDFVTELKAILFHKKTVIFPGLGRLRATKENNVFFVADEDLDIYPEGFGLEPISLKTHQATSSEVKAVVSDLKSILEDPQPVVLPEPVIEPEPVIGPEPVVEPDPVVEPEPVIELEVVEVEPEVEPETTVEDPVIVEPVEDTVEEDVVEVVEEIEPVPVVVEEPEPESEPESELESEPEPEPEEELPVAELIEEEEAAEDAAPAKKPVWKIILLVLMWIMIALVVLVGAYVAVSHLCPEWIDQFLYTPEELELLNNIYE